MPTGKLLVWEACGHRGIIGSQRVVVLMEGDAPGGEAP